MTLSQQTADACDDALRFAGAEGPGWNRAFLTALKVRGFIVRPVTPEEERRRPAGSMDAPPPDPTDPFSGWPVPSVIVPADDP